MNNHVSPIRGSDHWRGAAICLGLMGAFVLLDLSWIGLTYVGFGHHRPVEDWGIVLRIGSSAAALLCAYTLWHRWRTGRPVTILWAFTTLLQIGVQATFEYESHSRIYQHGSEPGFWLLPLVQVTGVLWILAAILYATRSRPRPSTPILAEQALAGDGQPDLHSL